MENRANNALIGLFTLAVIGLAVAFVYWFARASGEQDSVAYNIVFSGSVSGLSVGSNVLFNGIRVGQVKDLEIDQSDPSRVIAAITVRENSPIKTDTRARLEFQGLTGGANIQLSGGSKDSPALRVEGATSPPTIFAERSELQNLLDTAREVASTASTTLGRIDTLLRDNQSDITSTVKNIRVFSEALGNNSGNITSFLQATGDAAKALSAVSGSIGTTSDNLGKLIAAIDPAQVNRTLSNIEKASADLAALTTSIDAKKIDDTLVNVQAFSKTLADSRVPLQTFANDAAALTTRLNAMAPKLEASLDGIAAATKGIDSEKVASVIDNFEKFSASLGNNSAQVDSLIKDASSLAATLNAAGPKLEAAFAGIEKLTNALDGDRINRTLANVDKFSAALGNNSEAVDQFIKDAASVGSKLNATADRLDSILKSVDALVSGGDGKGMFAEIAEAARSIRALANNLDARTATLTNDIKQFTGSGLRDYQKLATDGQKTLKSIERALNSFERDPSQVIFGPRSKVPEFKPQ